MMACAAAIFGWCPNICGITFNLLFSTYILLESCFMLYFNVIVGLLPGSTSAMPVSLTQVTAWLSVKMYQGYTTVEHDLCTTCYERPPVLRDRFCWAEGVVAQDRFYCKCILFCRIHIVVSELVANLNISANKRVLRDIQIVLYGML